MTTIMIYSKHSSRCKNLFDRMAAANVAQFNEFQLLSIDNPKIRQRVKQDTRFEIKAVPCILNLYSTGDVEKYEDQDAFRYVETMIDKFAPPPQAELPPKVVETIHPSQDFERNRIRDDERVVVQEEPPRNKPQATPIDMLEEINDIPDDRHRIPQQTVPRLRQNDNTFIESKDLFPGEPVDNARELIKPVDKKISNPNTSMTKAQMMAQEREQIEAQINKPPQRK